jgi:cytosine/adenosine deaminase-related metal-dependent hydrolase
VEPLVVSGGTILSLDPQARVVRGDLVVGEQRILSVGGSSPAGARRLDATGAFVLPGLIQGHVHLGQTLFRGLAEERRLLDWLRQRIWPLEAAHDDESAYWSGMLGAAECLLSGTTTIQDIGIGPGARGLLRAIADSGLRAVAGKCLMDDTAGMPRGLAHPADSELAATEALGAEFDGAAGGRLRYALNPRFILSCSDDLWRGTVELAARRGWPIHTHALEQRDETEAVRAAHGGRDEVDYFDEVGVLAAGLRMAHGVWVEERHHQRLARHGTSVVHCPGSNLKLGSGICDVVALRRAGLAVGLGADGAACNNDLDALEEVRLAALLQTVRHAPGVFPALDALRLATSEGARALGLQGEIGSLEPGKKADLLVLDLSRPELWTPETADPHALVVYAASRASVRHVVVDGEVLVENGRLARLDVDQIRREASRTATELLRRARLE